MRGELHDCGRRQQESVGGLVQADQRDHPRGCGPAGHPRKRFYEAVSGKSKQKIVTIIIMLWEYESMGTNPTWLNQESGFANLIISKRFVRNTQA